MRRLLIVLTLLLAGTAQAGIQDGTRYFYWQKKADGVVILNALKKQGIRPFIRHAGVYYDERGLGSNAVLCGKRTDRRRLQAFVETIVKAGAKIQFVGPFYKREYNGVRDSIDLRSVNDERYHKSAKVLTLADLKRIPWRHPALCGITDGLKNWDEVTGN